MKFNILDYDKQKHKDIDNWIDEDKYQNAKLINKFATYNETISETYEYFINNPFDMANIKSFIKIFEKNNIFYGIVIFHYYVEKNIYYLGINPIIVNPNLMNKGIGTQIIQQIINEAKEIANGQVHFLRVNIEEKNIVSLKLIKKFDFKKDQIENNFTQYSYKL